MERIFEIEIDDRDVAALGQQLLNSRERVGRSRHRDGARAVDTPQFDAADRGHQLFDLLLRRQHGHHAAGTAREFLMRAAEMDDLDRGAQIEDAGRFGSRDLADAVAEHRRGTNAAARAAPR